MRNEVITTVILLICIALCICQIVYEVRIPEIKVSAAVSPAYPVIPRQTYFKAWCDARFDMKYIYSDDISFVGKSTKVHASRHFDNMILSENYAEEYAEANFFDVVAFELMDTGGVPLTVHFHYNHRFDDWNSKQMPKAEDFRTEPDYDFAEKHPAFKTGKYIYDEVYYYYTNGMLSTIRWIYKDYTISIYSNGDSESKLGLYPKGKDTYVNRLLDPETTHQAVQEMNDVIDWVFYTRPAMLRVASYAGCVVFFVGVVFLIVLRRRKKAACKKIEGNIP